MKNPSQVLTTFYRRDRELNQRLVCFKMYTWRRRLVTSDADASSESLVRGRSAAVPVTSAAPVSSVTASSSAGVDTFFFPACWWYQPFDNKFGHQYHELLLPFKLFYLLIYLLTHPI